ncbi:MAG: AAA family ATPase [Phycisphaerales bacterium]|nr:AAA family ATPase [Phycisphaerales bacterium]
MGRILGQDRAIATLRASLASDRVHHAWIFHGPKGVGKHTTAEAFARVLLDPDAEFDDTGEVRVDATSEAAQRFEAGTHPDLHLVTKELALYSDEADDRKRKLTNIPINVLRRHLVEPAYRRAVLAPKPRQHAAKVFIVDEAELLDKAQNSLLKVFEEPPLGTVIILVTAHEDRLLPTVRSRCQRVAFVPLDDEAMAAWAAEHLADVDADEAKWVLTFAAGSPGAALLAAQAGLRVWATTLEPMLRRLEEGQVPAKMGGVMAELIDTFAQQWVKKHTNASKEAANRMAMRLMLSLLAHRADEQLRLTIERGDDPEPAARVIDCFGNAERELHANLNLRMLLDHLVVRWAHALSRAS